MTRNKIDTEKEASDGHLINLTPKQFELIASHDVERTRFMIGKVCQLIETLGLQSKQEESVKGLVKDVLWTESDNSMKNFERLSPQLWVGNAQSAKQR